jgi:SAM-dependent methyltransferase
MTTTTYRDFSGTGAELYQRFFVPAIATPASAELLRSATLQAGERVLDIACGTGVVTRLAAAEVGPSGSVTGVDLAPDMIEVARSIDPGVGAPIDWHEGDAASLLLPDEAYDVVLCQMGLMFMEDKGGALAEMHRVLAPGGRLVINTPGRIQPPFEEMERAIAEHINPDLGGFVRAVFSMHDPAALEALVGDAGFVGVDTADCLAAFDLPSPAEFLWQYINLTPMGPLVAQAPDEAKTAMEAQVVETWASYVVEDRVPLAQPMVIAGGSRPKPTGA